MRSHRRGLRYRILLPIAVLVAGMSVALLLVVSRISRQVREDYHRFTVSSAAEHVTTILQLAAHDLTTARLLDNPVVVEAKKAAVADEITQFWSRSGLLGVVTGEQGKALFASLSPEALRAVLARRQEGYFSVSWGGQQYHALTREFPLWGWRITTAVAHTALEPVRREIFLLAPLVSFGVALLAGGLFLVLWRNLRQPVAEMVAAVAEEREIPETGITEFDAVGAAVNTALARVREREERIRLLLNSTAEGIYGVDLSGVCTFCNPACLRLVGLSSEGQLLGRNVHELIHHTRPDGTPYPESACRIYRAYREQRREHVDDEVFWRVDGSSFPVEYWSYPVVDAGTVLGAVVTFVDISERRRSEAFIRDILETVDEGFMVVDESYRIVVANRALAALAGLPLERVLNRTCHELFHGLPGPCPDASHACLLREALASGKPATGTHLHRRAGGDEVRVDLRAYPVRDAAGRCSSAIVTLTDVTEKSALEQQLRQAQKMEAVGRLAGGIAHDFNNMLMAIVGYASLGRELAEEGSRLRLYNDEVLAAAGKAADLTRQILAFSRKQVMSTAPCDLNGIVRGLQKIVARLLGEDIDFRVSLAGEALVALVDRAQIEQVLMNLCTNARDAMPGGGRLSIQTEAVDCDAEAAEVHGLEAPGRQARITVSDTGMGMDEPTRLRIFEPFFTTKEQGKGTGLGLSIVYGIVRQHRGQIAVYSEPGRGATFRIYLPLVACPAEAPAPPPAEARGGTETLLLAEDNDEVRALATNVLAAAGYQVLAAKDGEEAVRLFAQHEAQISLCLLDVVMPRLGGPEALERIRARRPGIRAVFMSGYASDLLDDARRAASGAGYLTKPLLPSELLHRVRDALDA